jgi:hypothetical protein
MIMNISSRYHCSKENLDTDLLLMSDSFSLYSNHSHFPVAQLGCSFSANIVFLVLHALQLGTLIKAHQASATSNFTVLNWVLLHKLSSFFFYWEINRGPNILMSFAGSGIPASTRHIILTAAYHEICVRCQRICQTTVQNHPEADWLFIRSFSISSDTSCCRLGVAVAFICLFGAALLTCSDHVVVRRSIFWHL